jgi:hypothetical protein
MRRNLLLALACLLALVAVAPAPALARGGSYTFDGGTPAEREQVRGALNASSFDWNVVPATIVVHIGAGSDSEAARGQIWLDADLLDSGEFSWATVQHEYAHQVDFFVLTDTQRFLLNAALGGGDWCYANLSAGHSSYGCERFASTLAWAYWPSRSNAFRPASTHAEAGAMLPRRFRLLLGHLLAAPPVTANLVVAPPVVR